VLRPLVIPDPEFGIGEADYCQIEIGIAAAMYGDHALVAMFNSDDVYSAIGKVFFRERLTPAELALNGLDFKRRYPALREQMKVCTLGIIYGLTPFGLALRLGVSRPIAAMLMTGFLDQFPTLRDVLRIKPAVAADRGYASSVSGLRRNRPVNGRPSQWERNWLANHPVQSSAATVFKSAGIRLDRLYPQYGARLIVPLYDAFVFEAPMEVLAEVAELTRRVMVEAVVEWFPQLRPRVEVNIENPSCWNKDGHADSIDKWVADPTFTL
jgi:DNA polymerase I